MSSELWKDIVLPIGTALTGAVIAIWAEPLRSWFLGPRINVEFVNADDCISKANLDAAAGEGHDSFFIRVRVTNNGRQLATAARVYLVGIEQLRRENYERTGILDPVQLAWSTRKDNDRFGPWDIPRDMPVYADLLCTQKGIESWEPLIEVHSKRYVGLYQSRGHFRFHVLVAGGNFRPSRCVVEFRWNGDWTSFGVNPAQTA